MESMDSSEDPILFYWQRLDWNNLFLVGLSALCRWLFSRFSVAEMVGQTIRYFFYFPHRIPIFLSSVISRLTRGNPPKVIKIAKTIQETLQSIVKCFETGAIPAADIPSANWSFINRIIMHLSNTADGRGFRQWKMVNRFVKKDAKAFFILVPRFINHENEKDEEKQVLAGLMARPIFRVEDTAGDLLEYEKIEVPELKLIERARDWSISVKAVPGNYRFYGHFSQNKMEIALASKEETVFFHELSYAAHSRVIIDFDKIQTWRKEIVAKLSAAVLCRLVRKTSRYFGNNIQYIKHYAKKVDLTPMQACMKVMGDVENVLNLVLDDEKSSQRIPISDSKMDFALV